MKALTKTQYEAVAEGIRWQVIDEYKQRAWLDKQVSWGRTVDRTDNEARISTLAKLVGWYTYSFSMTDKNFDTDKFRIACGFINN